MMIPASAIAIIVIEIVAAVPAFAQEEVSPSPPGEQAPVDPAPSCGPPCPSPPVCPSAPASAAPRTLMAMAYLGISGFKGQSGLNDAFGSDLKIGPSLRAGGMLGINVHAHISLDIELTIDFLNVDGGSSTVTSGVRIVAAFSPLFNLWTIADQQLVFGPKLGGWSSHLPSNTGETFTAHGYLLGLNLGDYFKMGEILVGGLLTYEVASLTQACAFGSCDRGMSGLRSEKALSLVASVLY